MKKAKPAPHTTPATVSKSAHQRAVRKLKRQLSDEKKDAAKRVKEAYIIGLSDQNDDEPPISFGRGALRQGYRTSKQSVRDETSISQEAAIERSYRQFATNPLAKSIADIRTDYVWGDGPTVVADNDEVKAILDAHWNDTVNDWDGKGAQRVRDLGLYGELIIEAFLRPADGRVRLGPIDPAEIAEVITSAENRDEMIGIRLKSIGEEQGQAGRLLKIIVEDDSSDRLVGVQQAEFAAARSYAAGDVITQAGKHWRVLEANTATEQFQSGFSNVRVAEGCYGRAWRVCEESGSEVRDPRTGAKLYGRIQDADAGLVDGAAFDGQCFMVTVNRTSIGMRGRPDALALIDWLDRYDQMFFDILEHAALLKDIVWDLLVTNGDETAVTTQARKFSTAQNQSGKVFAHNEKVVVNPQNPDLKGADWQSLSDTVLNLISGGSRYPVYMLGSGGDANLATATAQGGPTYRGFKTRQGVVQRLLKRILQFVIDSAVRAGTLPETVTVMNEDGGVDPAEVNEDEKVRARDAFTITMPEISTRDAAAAANTLAALVNAALTAYTGKLLPLKVCVEIIVRGAEQIGLKLDAREIVETLAEGASAPGLQPALDQAQQADQAAATDRVMTILKGFSDSGILPVVQQAAQSDQSALGNKVTSALAQFANAGAAQDVKRMSEASTQRSAVQPITLSPQITVNVPEQAAPTINVDARPTVTTMPSPQVTVEAAQPAQVTVNLPEQAAPQITVETAPPTINVETHPQINLPTAYITVDQPAAQVTVNVPEQPAPQVTVNVPKQAAPYVTVNVPEQPAPQVTVEAAQPAQVTVNVPEQAAPQVTVNVPTADEETIDVERNTAGEISRVTKRRRRK